jgi:mannose-1-phosphate guanylyltransferase
VCLAMLSLDPEEIALITPSDHYIDYSEKYQSAVLKAYESAQQGEIVIFGISPQSAETGYGYIEAAQEGAVRRFHEKPSLEIANEYLKQGNFYWNSGMICAKAGVLLKAMEKHAPEILRACRNAYKNAASAEKDPAVCRIAYNDMMQIPSDSIDYALLEKMHALKIVAAGFSWSDVGSFDALYMQLTKDGEGNALAAKHFVSIDSRNNLIIGNQRMISTIDVENLAIVDTPDALLISRLGSTQKVRAVVNELKTLNTTLHQIHIEEERPWGCFTVLEASETYKVKRIVVSPGKRLSLQKHQYRSEHWVVVTGEALVTVGNEQKRLQPNQSVYIPLGEIHRIENPGEADLVIIEVQCGTYTGEDDIIRLQDDFARIPEQTCTR